jgi:AraC-like DNA-binding protein
MQTVNILSSNLLSTLCLDLLSIEKITPNLWWSFKQVNSPFSRLYLVDSGTAFVRHHEKTWQLTSESLHLIPCFCTCDYFCEAPFSLYCLSFTARLAGGRDLFNLGQFEFNLSANTEDKTLFERLLNLNPDMALIDYNPYKPAGQIFPKPKKNLTAIDAATLLESAGILRQLLSPFLRTTRPSTQVEHTQVRRFDSVFSFIEGNLNHPIELRNLAAVIDMTPTYFSDLFHRTFGERPIVFINRRRVEKAQLLLLTTELQIQEVANLCGFSSTPYFTRTFRKYASESPLRYRKKHQSF